MEERFFTCPECGGHHFGTTGIAPQPEIGHCNDQYGEGCQFEWDRADDAKLPFINEDA